MNNAYFIRHNFFINDREKKKKYEKQLKNILKNKNCIAIHYGDDEILDKEWDNKIQETQDKQFKKAGEIFKNLRKEGGYIFAQYDIEDKIILGKILPGAEIIYLDELKSKDLAGFKCLQFSDTFKEYSLTEFPVLFALRPIQQTIAKLNHVSTEIIKQIFENGSIKHSLEFLPPKFQELLVQEWLRSKHSKEFKLKYQFILTGKDYPLFDITGETILAKNLYAQITFHNKKSNPDKFKKFEEIKVKHGDIKIMFSNESTFTNKEGKIHYKNLNDVLKEFIDDPDYAGFISKIFGFSE